MDQKFDPRQCNNVYIFLGLGLGVIASQSKLISDDMFLTAANTIPKFIKEDDLSSGRIFPKLEKIREISMEIAKNIVISSLNNINSKEKTRLKKIQNKCLKQII